MPASEVDASFVGEGEDEFAGKVGHAGDVNGDGYDDFLVGAIGSHDSNGGAYLVLGRDGGWTPFLSLSLADVSFAGETVDDWAGSSVGGVGDVNGDGLADFTIGASETWGEYKSRGKTYLLLGKTSGWIQDQSLESADASFDPGFDSSGGSGGIVAGDVNDDGYDDFAFSESYTEDGDQHDGTFSFLFLGRPDPWGHNVDYHDADTSFAAGGCKSVGDLNGDGLVDLTCRTPEEDDSGQTHLFFDAPSLLGTEVEMDVADASYIGEQPEDRARPAMGRGDVNGDGFDDLVATAYYNDEGAPNGGQVYLVLGRSGGWSQSMPLAGADASWHGEEDWDQAGRTAAAIAGDVNGDGFDDILVGAWHNDESAHSAGQVYLILGEPHPDCPGDLDGDGWGDPGHADCPNGDETDCDDGDPWVNPGVEEACNGVDDDCDGELPDDEADLDGDGYLACAEGDLADCDDDDPSIHADAAEECDDGVDNDCDGLADGEDEDCSEGDDDDDSADDDTTGPGDDDDDDDDDCQCRGDGVPRSSAGLGVTALLFLLIALRQRI